MKKFVFFAAVFPLFFSGSLNADSGYLQDVPVDPRERLEVKLAASGLTEKEKDAARANLERQLEETGGHA